MISIQALQLGGNDLSLEVVFSEDVKWNYEPELNASDPEYDIAFILRELSEEEAKYLNRHVRAHCLFFLAGLKQNSENYTYINIIFLMPSFFLCP